MKSKISRKKRLVTFLCYGYMDYAFEYIIENGGIVWDKDYPYTGRNGTRDVTKKNVNVVSIEGYEDVPINDDLALQKAVTNPPVIVAIEAYGRDFQFYDSARNPSRDRRVVLRIYRERRKSMDMFNRSLET